MGQCWRSVGFSGNEGAQTQGIVELWKQECQTLPHPTVPCHTFHMTFHQLKGTVGREYQEAQKNETLLPNLLSTSEIILIRNGKCHWSRVTKWIVILATFNSLEPALCRLKSSNTQVVKIWGQQVIHKKRIVNTFPTGRTLDHSDSVTHSYKTLHEDMVYLTSFCSVSGTLPVFSSNLRNMDGKH